MTAAELLDLAWQARRASSDDDALVPLSLLAAHVVKLTGEDSCAVFAALRAPPPIPLKTPAPHRAVKAESLDAVVESVAAKLQLVPVPRED